MTGSVEESLGPDPEGAALGRAMGVQLGGTGNVQYNYFTGPVETAYLAQLRDLAPYQLLGREREIEQIQAFLRSDDGWLWIQGGPWAGKSALMATLALAPPQDVDIVCCFVTARLAGSTDHVGFTEGVLEQLSARLQVAMPASGAANTRDGHRRQLLTDAADEAHDRGRTLLLVVDGLDEDTGPARGDPSIASLLPRRREPGLKVLVASRPNPGLAGDAVGHPLGRAPVMVLAPSNAAVKIRDRAEHELSRLLAGDPTGRELLALVTASGGGLTREDLSDLTAQPLFVVHEVLRGTTGRTFELRSGSQPWTGHGVILAHETLHVAARDQLGEVELRNRREQLHGWAAGYRDRGWPPETPPYLLRGYPRMLAGAGETARLLALVTDPARSRRLAETSEGDAAVIEELILAHRTALAADPPDLVALARASARRARMEDRHEALPVALPPVLARLGHPGRAEAMARAMPGYARYRALIGIGVALVEAGDLDGGSRLLVPLEATSVGAWVDHLDALLARGDDDAAERLARDHGTDGMVFLLRRCGERGDVAKAERLAEEVGGELAAAQLVRALAAAGEEEAALRWLDRVDPAGELADPMLEALVGDHPRLAEAWADRLAAGLERALALAQVPGGLAAPDADEAVRLRDRALAEIDALETELDRLWLRLVLATTLAWSGHEGLAREIVAPALARLDGTLAPDAALVAQRFAIELALGDLADAAARVAEVDEDSRDSCLAELALAYAERGESARALATQARIENTFVASPVAEQLAAQLLERDPWEEALPLLVSDGDIPSTAPVDIFAEHVVATGCWDRVDELLADLTSGYAPQRLLREMARACASAGHTVRAEEYCERITSRRVEEEARAEAAAALLDRGDAAGAARLVATIDPAPPPDASALIAGFRGLVRAGAHDEAERVLEALPDSLRERYGPEVRMARVLRERDTDTDAEGPTPQPSLLELRLQVAEEADVVAFEAVAEAVAEGRHDDAEEGLTAFKDPDIRQLVALELGRALARSGDLESAQRALEQVCGLPWTLQALTELVAGVTRIEGVAAGVGYVLDRTDAYDLRRIVGFEGVFGALLAQGRGAEVEGVLDSLDPEERGQAESGWWRALLAVGALDEAEARARSGDPAQASQRLAEVAEAAAGAGDPARAEALLAGVRDESGHPDRDRFGRSWLVVAGAAVEQGDLVITRRALAHALLENGPLDIGVAVPLATVAPEALVAVLLDVLTDLSEAELLALARDRATP